MTFIKLYCNTSLHQHPFLCSTLPAGLGLQLVDAAVTRASECTLHVDITRRDDNTVLDADIALAHRCTYAARAHAVGCLV